VAPLIRWRFFFGFFYATQVSHSCQIFACSLFDPVGLDRVIRYVVEQIEGEPHVPNTVL